MTQNSTLTRWSKMVLVRAGAGLTLGLIASSFITVTGRDTDGIDIPPSAVSDATHSGASNSTDCTRAFAALCESDTNKAMEKALVYTRNSSRTDKADDGAFYTEASYDPKFDPCQYSDGRQYVGKGTVMNPHADFYDCLPKVAIASDAFQSDNVFELEGGGDAAGTANPQTDYLNPWGPGSAIYGPNPGGFPIGQIITGTPTISPEDGNPTDPPTDPIPLPAPFLLFATGLAGIAGLRRKMKAA